MKKTPAPFPETSTLADPRAWQAETIDAPTAWRYELSSRCRSRLDQTLRELREKSRETTDLRVADTPLAESADELRDVLHALEVGRGFVIIEGLPNDVSRQELQAAYWLIGQLLGQPIAQNVEGTLLYDVRDTGQSVQYGSRFSVTNAESSFHTDNSFGDDVLDYVGLLCLQPAKSGGLSQLISGFAAYRELQSRDPQALEILSRPFHVDRRGGVRPGELPTVQFPVLARQGGELLLRYLRYWIEVGHEKAKQPLTPAQRAALDTLDDVLREPRLRVEFHLRPGDMFFINNRWLFHNRTAFDDDSDPDRKRHLVRLWLRRPQTQNAASPS